MRNKGSHEAVMILSPEREVVIVGEDEKSKCAEASTRNKQDRGLRSFM